MVSGVLKRLASVAILLVGVMAVVFTLGQQAPGNPGRLLLGLDASQEAVDAIRVNRQVRTVGVYDAEGALVAGYGRDGDNPPPGSWADSIRTSA